MTQQKLDVKRNLVYPTTVRLEIQECPACGVVHGVPKFYADQMRANADDYFCPNGHKIGWHESDLDREKVARQRAERAAANAEEAARIQRRRAEHEERRARALKGHLTRMKNRIANGVCPVPGCKRSGFSNVMSHIAQKHPAWHHDHADEL